MSGLCANPEMARLKGLDTSRLTLPVLASAAGVILQSFLDHLAGLRPEGARAIVTSPAVQCVPQ